MWGEEKGGWVLGFRFWGLGEEKVEGVEKVKGRRGGKGEGVEKVKGRRG